MVLPQHAQHALLPVPTAKLVPNDRVSVQPGLDVDLGQGLAAGADDGDLVHNGSLLSLLPALPLTLCRATTILSCDLVQSLVPPPGFLYQLIGFLA